MFVLKGGRGRDREREKKFIDDDRSQINGSSGGCSPTGLSKRLCGEYAIVQQGADEF